MDPRRLSPERYVAHDCDVRFERPVFDRLAGNCALTACIRCGVVTFTSAAIDEPHPNDVRHLGNDVVALAPEVLAWVAEWPRRIRGRDEARWIFLPRGVRASALEELDALEAGAERDLAACGRREALVRSGIPAAPAQRGVVRELEVLCEVHEEVFFQDRDDPRALLRLFARGWHTLDVYADVLTAQPDLVRAVEEALDIEPLQTAALRVVDHEKLVTPRVLTYLDAALRSLTPETHQPYALVQLAVRLGAPALLGALEEAARKNGPERSYYFHEDLTTAIARLRS
jgi:hypothetical protein